VVVTSPHPSWDYRTIAKNHLFVGNYYNLNQRAALPNFPQPVLSVPENLAGFRVRRRWDDTLLAGPTNGTAEPHFPSPEVFHEAFSRNS
jgi:hypothetical protein